jgi:hypothetical protein
MQDTLTVAEHTEAHGDKIKGYRKLSEAQIEMINTIKAEGQQLEALIRDLDNDVVNPDPRWLEMARTDLQVSLMKLTRAVAKPEFF